MTDRGRWPSGQPPLTSDLRVSIRDSLYENTPPAPVPGGTLPAPPEGWDWARELTEVRARSSDRANAFDLGEPEDLEALAQDIAEHGQLLPILRRRGLIEDGRRREVACRRAGVAPVYDDLDGLDEAATSALVLGLNHLRRHSGHGALVIAAARCIRASTRRGVPVGRLAAALRVRRQAVYDGLLIVDFREDLADRVAAGEVRVRTAAALAREEAGRRRAPLPSRVGRNAPGKRVPRKPETALRRFERLYDEYRDVDPRTVAAVPVSDAQRELDLLRAKWGRGFLDAYIRQSEPLLARRRGATS